MHRRTLSLNSDVLHISTNGKNNLFVFHAGRRGALHSNRRHRNPLFDMAEGQLGMHTEESDNGVFIYVIYYGNLPNF